ncbi:MAG: helicase-related protein [Rubripirellula sp.]
MPINGRYTPVSLIKQVEGRDDIQMRGHIRHDAFPNDCCMDFSQREMNANPFDRKQVPVSDDNPLQFEVSYRSRRLESDDDWLVTITLTNRTQGTRATETTTSLFQSFFEVTCTGGATFQPYPEPPQTVDDDEKKSLELLYSKSKTWGIGHNCAAGWTTIDEQINSVFADVLPVTETASMTPDIEDSGSPLRFSMIELSNLQKDGTNETWEKLQRLVDVYGTWIKDQRADTASLGTTHKTVAGQHLDVCELVLLRISNGLAKLESDPDALHAFRLANKSMVMQQLATKSVKHRPLVFNANSGTRGRVEPEGTCVTPFKLLDSGEFDSDRIGNWRAFQLAFLLMNVPEFVDENNSEEFARQRSNVELIWFPTGGGKTEAYLGVAAYSMFIGRIRQKENPNEIPQDGTNVIMRYTLRMLTTQQFQRAAALICSMECLRQIDKGESLAGGEFSLGLWIGGEGSPNKNERARDLITSYRNENKSQRTNPLILTECPWCRAALGRAEDLPRPRNWDQRAWQSEKLKGIKDVANVPQLCCSDKKCKFNDRLPVVVVDEQLYENPASLVIGTADKFAVLAYRPDARSLFGRGENGDVVRRPPNLIIQDELHLIAGPLGTLFGLYESIIDELCTFDSGCSIKPKIVCSTATIRGARDQIKSVFARDQFTLFPPPGIDISDSFFGKYAADPNTKQLLPGRMYVGVNAPDFVSSQTTQVRIFSSLFMNAQTYIDKDRRDPWWTNLIFFNSLRELGGSATLFQGDVKARLKFLKWRDSVDFRKDPRVVELSSRLKQDEIIDMLDRLANEYPQQKGRERPLDACLASNIIEVGVDIDRLSLMCVVGQPKNTAQYIQVTGRVGRRWQDRPGLVFTLYSPTKIRDKSHFEQFYSYHNRLYEQVEPTSATPFSRSSLERGVIGAMLVYARLTMPKTGKPRYVDYATGLDAAKDLLIARCRTVEKDRPEQAAAAEQTIERIALEMKRRWSIERDQWDKIPLGPDDSVLLRWPGQFVKTAMKRESFEVPSSLRQVDGSGELMITKFYQTESDR